MTIHHQNWSGHAPFHATRFHEPTTVGDIQEIVRQADKVHVIGSRHCFNDIADSTGDMISLSKMPSDLVIDRGRHTATVNAGITYRELCPQLHEAGYALHNMASLDHITVIGACMSATHGSGDTLGNLASIVSALEIVIGNGDLVTVDRENDGDRFTGMVVALGSLGVVTRVTLDLVPTFNVQQHVYQKLPFTNVYESFDEIMGAGYSVSLFPTWQEDHVESVWVKQQVPTGESDPVADPTFHGATLPPDGHYWDNPPDRQWTPVGSVGPWHQRLPHFTFNNAQKEGNELQSEYFVARPDAVNALKAVSKFRDQVAPILGVTEIRSVAADDLWLSTAYGHDVIGIHFNWHKDWAGVSSFLPSLETALAPFSPRPHWGKLFAMTPKEIQSRYPKLNDFRSLAQDLDSTGKFRNPYADKYIFNNT